MSPRTAVEVLTVAVFALATVDAAWHGAVLATMSLCVMVFAALDSMVTRLAARKRTGRAPDG